MRNGSDCHLGCHFQVSRFDCGDPQVRAIGAVWALLAGGSLATIAVTGALFARLVGIAVLAVLVHGVVLCSPLSLGHVTEIGLRCLGKSELTLWAFTSHGTVAFVLAWTTTAPATATASAATSIAAFSSLAAFAFPLGCIRMLVST